MSLAAVPESGPPTPGSADAIRAALAAQGRTEDRAEFEAAYAAALRTGPSEVDTVLAAWRQIAARSPHAWAATQAAADEIRRTGHSRPGAVSWSTLRTELDL